MNARRALSVLALLPLLAGCTAATQYTESEALNQLSVDRTSAAVDVRFAPGSDQLLAGDAVRLRRLAATHAISRADRITVAAAGGPDLATARAAAVAAELLPYGIVVTGQPVGAAPYGDRAVVAVDRTLVRLPDCPNWSKPNASTDFTNTLASNFGCATVTNLGRMVANPTDLASGQPLGFVQATPAVAAIGRYQADRVPLAPEPPGSGFALTPEVGAELPAAAAGGSATAADLTAISK